MGSINGDKYASISFSNFDSFYSNLDRLSVDLLLLLLFDDFFELVSKFRFFNEIGPRPAAISNNFDFIFEFISRTSLYALNPIPLKADSLLKPFTRFPFCVLNL